MTKTVKHTEIAAAADEAAAARNEVALKTLAKDRDDIGDDPETLRMIEESRRVMAERTEAFVDAQTTARKKSEAPGAASTPARSSR